MGTSNAPRMQRRRTTKTLPPGFNPDDPGAMRKLDSWVKREHGADAVIEDIDSTTNTVSIIYKRTVTSVAGASGDVKKYVDLQDGFTLSHGERVDAQMRERNPGYYMTMFDPFNSRAILMKLTEDVVSARGHLAESLGCKPWDVQVSRRRGGGFMVQLPPSYVESRHRKKLDEAIERNIGKPGWYAKIDHAKKSAEIIPGELPTFSPAYPYPFDAPAIDPFSIPLGVALGGPGKPNYQLDIRLGDNAGGILQGLAGSGKSVSVNAIIFGVLARGHDLVLINVAHKATDFDWCKPFVRSRGWGCESKAAAVAAISMVYEEGQRRGEILREHGVQKWQELPASVRKELPIISIVMDELSALFLSDPIPKSLPKDHPERMDAEQKAMETDLLTRKVVKIPAEMRAAGLRLLLASQQAQKNTGIPPSVKLNLPNRILLGPNATKQARGHAFANPDSTPWVPEYIAEDEAISKGVGVAEFEGQPATVFKSFYASTSDFRRQLEALGVRRTTSPEPTYAQIMRYVPQLDEDMDDDGPPPSALDRGGFGEVDGRDKPEPRLKGAAAAAHQLRVEAQQAQKASS